MILPQVGKLYKFSFLPDFAALDGVYLVEEHLTYTSATENGDIARVYEKVGKEEDFDGDSIQYRSSVVLKLVPQGVDPEPLFVPAPLIKETPDPTVQEYPKLALVVNVGACGDEEKLSYIVNMLNEVVVSGLGLDEEVYIHKYGSVSLTDAEYAQIEAERADRMESVETYFSENRELQKRVTRLSTHVTVLEEIIKSLKGV